MSSDLLATTLNRRINSVIGQLPRENCLRVKLLNAFDDFLHASHIAHSEIRSVVTKACTENADEVEKIRNPAQGAAYILARCPFPENATGMTIFRLHKFLARIAAQFPYLNPVGQIPKMIDERILLIIEKMGSEHRCHKDFVDLYARLGSFCSDKRFEIENILFDACALCTSRIARESNPADGLILIFSEICLSRNLPGAFNHTIQMFRELLPEIERQCFSKPAPKFPIEESDSDEDSFDAACFASAIQVRVSSKRPSCDSDDSDFESDSDSDAATSGDTALDNWDVENCQEYEYLIRTFVGRATAYQTENSKYHKELANLFTYIGQIPNNRDAAHKAFRVYIDIIDKIDTAFEAAVTVADKTAYIKLMAVYLSHKPVYNHLTQSINILHARMCTKLLEGFDLEKTKNNVPFHRAVLRFLSKCFKPHHYISEFSSEMMTEHVSKLMEQATTSGSALAMKNVISYFN